ncbi:hypothetical protein HJFPF1_01118 [Paramyrothecium foliicola]|nr:hypothetical protein HJFPF1_01118 [Paramyrothecium foliicola]
MNSENNQNNNESPSGRRRSSGLMPAFDSLHQQKRSDANIARRQSMSDQHVRPGFFSSLFHNNLGRNGK